VKINSAPASGASGEDHGGEGRSEAAEADPAVFIGGPLLGETSTVSATRGLFVAIALLMMGNGLTSVTLGVRSSSEGFGLAETGAVMASFYLGFLAGSVYCIRMLARVGHIRLFAALASTASSAVLVHSIWVNPGSWAVMRCVIGACMASLYVVVESWLNDRATNLNRGRLLALYMVVSMGGLSIGQLLLNVADPGGFRLFILASVLVSMSLVPISLSVAASPPLEAPEPLSLTELMKAAPVGIVCSFWVGASHGILLGIGSVFAIAAGLDAGEAAIFATAPIIGSVALQWPVGILADRAPRRVVIVGVAAAAALLALVMTFVEPGSYLGLGVMFGLGGMTFSLYSLVLAHTSDWVSPTHAAGASAGLLRVNGGGAVVGPLVTAALMQAFSPTMYFYGLGVTHVIICLYVFARIVVDDDAEPLELQRRFVALPARTGGFAGALLRPREASRPRNPAGVDVTGEANLTP